MRKFLLLIAGITGVALIIAAPAGAASGDVYCPQPPAPAFVGPVTAPHDLIVPPGTFCGPTQGSTVGHDVIVGQGAGFFPGGTTIGHDVRSHKAAFIELGDPNNGTTDTIVGHDVLITGTQGGVPVGDFICQTRIGHDLVVKDSAATASEWDIGDPLAFNCARNLRPGDTIGHDGIFDQNANAIDVGDNNATFNGGTGPGFGHDLKFTNNHGTINRLINNTVVHDCKQSDNHPFLGFGNSAGHSVDACNSSNP